MLHIVRRHPRLAIPLLAASALGLLFGISLLAA